MVTRDEYRIGWICALSVEMAAAKAMLDKIHPVLPNRKDDRNKYTLGSIGLHNIVITCLPAGLYGTTFATATAIHMRYSYASIETCFMVGIGGGVPSDHDIRLGDVVVSEPTARYGGVLQYDRGKAVDGRTSPMGILDKPPEVVLRALCGLKAKHMLYGNHVDQHYNQALEKYPLLRGLTGHPGHEADQLYAAEYNHVAHEPSCHRCDVSMLQRRSHRPDDKPRIFYGLVASGNKVIKDAKTRDHLAQLYGILCFETEAAGLMDIFPCLVIRGVCDYADSHKNKRWQGYAAIVAAAYAKELLLYLPSHEIPRPVTDSQCHETKPETPICLSPSSPNATTASCQSDEVTDTRTVIETIEAPAPLEANPPDPTVRHVAPAIPLLPEEDDPNSILSNEKESCEHAPLSRTDIPATVASQIDPQAIIATNLSIARRQSSWHPFPAGDCSGVFRALRNWLSTTQSTVLTASTESRNNSRFMSFATEVTHFLLQWNKAHREQMTDRSDYQVLWVLRSPDPASNNHVEIIKSLIHNAVQLYPEILNSDVATLFKSEYKESELWHLLRLVLARITRAFVIIHTKDHELTMRLLVVAGQVTTDGNSRIKFLVICEGGNILDPSWSTVRIPAEPPQSTKLRSRPLYVKSMTWNSLSPSF